MEDPTKRVDIRVFDRLPSEKVIGHELNTTFETGRDVWGFACYDLIEILHGEVQIWEY